MYDYNCTIVRIVDGDTVDIDIDLGFGIIMTAQRVRIAGIDTPESRTRDLVEKQFGLASKKRCEELLPMGSKQVLLSQLDRSGDVAKGKFGRILGDFQLGDKTFTEIMLEEGQAAPYSGGSKEELEAIMLANRERLLAEGTVILDPNFK